MATESEEQSLRGRLLEATAQSHFLRRLYGACRRVPVFGSLLHGGVDRLFPHGSRVWRRLADGLGKGLWFNCDPRFESGYWSGDHEPWVQDVLKAQLKPGDCFYDVGAHTGFFSLIGARFVGDNGLVVAFEADPENAALLRVNANRNQIAQVKLIEAAVWSSPGAIHFERASRSSNRTEGHVAPDGKGNSIGITVAATSLDEVIYGNRERAPQLVKIDVEGAEWEVLQGAHRMLAELRPELLCEVHEPAKMQAFRAFLGGFRYTTEHWQPVHPRYAEYRQHYIWAVARQ